MLWLLWALSAAAIIVYIGAFESSNFGRLREIAYAIAYTKLLALCLSAALLVVLFTCLHSAELRQPTIRRISTDQGSCAAYSPRDGNSSPRSPRSACSSALPSPRGERNSNILL